MRARTLLVAILVSLSACNGAPAGQVLVIVHADSGLVVSGISSFRCTASIGGTAAKPFTVPLGARAPLTIPPTISFAVEVPSSLAGAFQITVEAHDGSDRVLASGTGQTQLASGRSARVDVILGRSVTGDMALSPDGATDLGSDGAMPDASVPAVSPICTTGGWCWSDPRPQGNDLLAVFDRTSSDVWAVGAGGTILHFDGTAWSAPPSGTSATLHGVWAAGPSLAFAVGEYGFIRQWNVSWSGATSPTSASLRAVYGISATDVWAVGDGGTTLHYDGTAWSSVANTLGSTNLYGVWGATTGDVWAVGSGGIAHWDGTAWTSAVTSTTAYNAISGRGASDIWAVGYMGKVLRYNGSAWVSSSTGSVANLTGVWATPGAANVWVAAADRLLRYDGTSWSGPYVPSDTVDPFLAIHGSTTDAWAVGLSGGLHHFDGATWSPKTVYASPTQIIGDAVWGFATTDVWIGGPGLWHYDGASFTKRAGPTSVQGLWGTRTSNLWAVGNGGAIWHWDGTTLSQASSSTLQDLSSIWGTGAGDIWAVGGTPAGTVVHFDGSAWSPSTVPTGTIGLQGVWADSTTGQAWAVGASGTILRYSGGTWTAATSGTAATLFDVWGASATDVWAVGVSGQLDHWDGSNWTPSTFTSSTLLGVWGTGTSDIWAVGQGGTLIHYTGSWMGQTSGSASYLRRLWGLSSTDIWAVGAGVLHHGP